MIVAVTCCVPTPRGLLSVLAEYHDGDRVAYAVTCAGVLVPMATLNLADTTAVIGACDDARRALKPGPTVPGLSPAHARVAS